MAERPAVEKRNLRPGGRKHPLMIAALLAAGGTAKTTTTVNLATELGIRGYFVRVFDLDPQCNASETFGRDAEWRDPDQPTLYDVITDQQYTIEDASVPALYRVGPGSPAEGGFAEIPNVMLVYGDNQLKGIDAFFAMNGTRLFWLQDLINGYSSGEFTAQENEVWLFDLPANYGQITVSAIIPFTEDDEVIPPLMVTRKESVALDKIFDELQEMRDRHRRSGAPARPTVKNILLCLTPTSQHDAREYHDTVTEVEGKYGDKVLPHVRYSAVAARQYGEKCPPAISDPKSAPSVDYAAVADALGFPDLLPER